MDLGNWFFLLGALLAFGAVALSKWPLSWLHWWRPPFEKLPWLYRIGLMLPLISILEPYYKYYIAVSPLLSPTQAAVVAAKELLKGYISGAIVIGSLIKDGAVWYNRYYLSIGPILTLVAGISVAVVAFLRHLAQTKADRHRRITENFSKAIEQLGSDKLEVRIGGIYSLERISKESPEDYWTITENLMAFIRERSRRNELERTSQNVTERIRRRAYLLWQKAGEPNGRSEEFWSQAVEREKYGDEPAPDIATALTVIGRRVKQSRKSEFANRWRVDLSNAFLVLADLKFAHFEGADLAEVNLAGASLLDAHFENAFLAEAHFEGASMWGTHFENAFLMRANFEGANLEDAHFEGANLEDAHLERADLKGTHLRGANLMGTHLDGANLSSATGLSEAQLLSAHGDTSTKLPTRLKHPAHWQCLD